MKKFDIPRLSNDDQWVLGVCGGLGEYFGVNSNILRALVVLSGIGIVPYLVAALIMSMGNNN